MSFRRRTPVVLVLAGLLAGGALATPASGGEKRVVLELFTSQGCSSCPPADKLLSEYAEQKDVLALSFSVDYWDYLGWKDTLASPEFSERQRSYAAMRGDRDVYTPQIVIDGTEHVVGSNRASVAAAVKKRMAEGLPVPITLSPKENAVTVDIGAAPAGTAMSGTIWLVMYDRSVSVPVGRGENAGRTITYSNVVRKLRPIAMWRGQAMSVDLPRSEIKKAKVGRCAVLLQTENDAGQPGAILGASAVYYDKKE